MESRDFYRRGSSGLQPHLTTPPGVRDTGNFYRRPSFTATPPGIRPYFIPTGIPPPDNEQHVPESLVIEQKLDFLFQQFTEHKDFITSSIQKITTELEEVKRDIKKLNEKAEGQSCSSQSSKKLPKQLSVDY